MAIARFQLVAIDCPDPVALAEFYSVLTGWPLTKPHADYPEWVQLRPEAGATIAFQRVDDIRETMARLHLRPGDLQQAQHGVEPVAAGVVNQ